jgi:O-methyltransferase involved in polyketide biosynthesis
MTARSNSARISPTAWYTGQVWNRNLLSEPGLMGWRGPLLHTLGAPALVHVPAMFGVVTMDQILLARHRLLDAAIVELVEQQGVGAAMEIAAGLGARGLRLVRRFGAEHLRWVDADLPDMAALRRAQLGARGPLPDGYNICPIDILATEGELAMPNVLSAPPLESSVVVLMEGLLNYFPKDVALEALGRLRATLAQRTAPSFVAFEVHTQEDVSSIKLVRPFLAGLSVFARGKVALHYRNLGEAVDALHELGFKGIAEVRLPEAAAWPVVRVLVAAVHDPDPGWVRAAGPLHSV